MSKSAKSPLTALLVSILFIVLVSSTTNAANHQLKRRVAPKQVYTELPEHSDCSTIVFKLREGVNRPSLSENRFLASGGNWASLNDILTEVDGQVTLKPRFSVAPSRLDKMRTKGSRRVGWQLPDLTLYFDIQLDDNLSDGKRLALINQLNSLDLVELAYFAPESSTPSGPPEGKGPKDPDPEPTPPFEYGQYYLRPAPVGFDAFYAWSFPGGHGENAKVIDVETSWNQTHEDLHGGTDDFHIAGEIDETDDLYHGTAVLGIIASDSNDFGTTGIAYEAELGTVSTCFMSDVDAIVIASANAGPGDIILIEKVVQHWIGAYICVEWEQACFDAILTASALGQIVVEPAGNFWQDLDNTVLFDSLFYPEYRFSGAIMVAMSTAFHVPDARTCYGQRIDVHGFGTRDVYTLSSLNYAHLWGTEDDNSYTCAFSGTSAAGAEIAGVCAVVESIYEEQTSSTLDHTGMRNLLTTYSVPQADHDKNIGPMPDLAGICNAITGQTRPEAPALVSPDDGAAYTAPAQPTLDWDDVTGAMSYDIMIDDNFNFISPAAQEEGLTSSEWLTPMLQQGKYFWRARAVNANGFGAWSEVRTILVDVSIQAPVLLTPEDGDATKTSRDVPLEWYQVDGVADYVVEVDSLPNFSSLVRSTYASNCTDGICSFEIARLNSNDYYYWRIKALGDDTPWSEVWEFLARGSWSKTAPATSEESGGEPGSLRLGTNYPNPFNPDTRIEFYLPEAGHARLEVFNILGQKVATLLNEYLPAGRHGAVWNAATEPSGVYLYRLTTSDKSVSGKMVLLK